jgi:hypothetical protein
MGIVAQDLVGRCSEPGILRRRSAFVGWSVWVGAAAEPFSVAVDLQQRQVSVVRAVTIGPVPPDRGTRCDVWIMRLPPMAVPGIAEVDHAGRFR